MKKWISQHFLYANPSFLEGLARIIDFGNALQEYNASSTPELADEIAIRADWQAVGNDMFDAIASVDIEQEKYE